MLINLPEVFSRDEVRDIRETLVRVPFAESQRGLQGAEESENFIKNNFQAPFGHPAARPAGEAIGKRLLESRAFGAATFPRRVQLLFNRYEAGMYYRPHTDPALMMISKGESARADVAFTILLSQPDEYQGGEFVLDLPGGAARFREAAGSVIVYDPGTPHSVEEVSEGERWAVDGWAESYLADPVERQLHYDLVQLIEEVNAAGDPAFTQRFEDLRERLLRHWIDT